MFACRTSVSSKASHVRIRQMAICFSRAMSSEPADDVLFQSAQDKGIIVLNRPKALNALNLSMCEKIFPVMKKWEKEKSMVIIKGAGEKAFCAGGDVRAIAAAALKGDTCVGKNFFRCEYTLNNLIGTYQIPYVALIHGITMGGGVGLSVHGTYQVATETTLFAMPETAIGLFPDVGGSFFLPRLGGKLGLFLALSGHRLKGNDVVKAGIASHFCDSSKLPELEKALICCTDPQNNAVKILDEFSKKSSGNKGDFSLAPYLKQIDQCFSASCVEEIFQKLEKDGSEWAVKLLDSLKQMSPTSMKISHRELQEGACMNLQECLIMEYRLGCHACEGHDFIEGVKALLIDKGRKPEWKPSTLEEVTPDILDKAFASLPPSEELQL
ncbi:hypothetical protein R5R35_011061 [Gryllus longicercus]|uniref:3-hydroxyisobutyryl-CoA hydrolase, mitochondrial n=1 Tax=Gryllus longicercus TaxID=2509291 RepID=A0AAN9ZD34_9ORTH